MTDARSKIARGAAVLSTWLLVTAANAQGLSADLSDDLGVPYLIPPGVVDLNDKQRDTVASIRRELHDRYCTLSGELLLAQEDLRAQLARQPRSRDAVAEASRRVAELRERMQAARAEAQERAVALLAPKQRSILAKWQEGQRGTPGGEDVPYTVLPGIQQDEPDIENPEDPQPRPRN